MGTILGIDAGGTYTDAVVCDSATRKIYAEAKALTTKEKLEVGIRNAIENLPKEYYSKVDFISLSTTLATNACVEDKGCHALLILFGIDLESWERFGSSMGRFDKEDVWCIETNTQMSGEILKVPDWEWFLEILKEKYSNYDSYAIVEIYSLQTGGFLEKTARKIVSECFQKPVVCGYELFNELNVMKRGANALLNAKLIPVIQSFLKAVNRVKQELQLNAPIMIVRSDGTLMSESFAKTHPIETLLCGPVASAVGAEKLTSCKNAIIVDMGGTTSDIALLKDSKPVTEKNGVNIGGWKTFVQGMFVDTFGLGGDTQVQYKDGKLTLGINRVIPICMLASEYPEILSELEAVSKKKAHTRRIYECLVLQHELEDKTDYTENELKICEVLKTGPHTIDTICSKTKLSVYEMDTRRLEKTGVLMRSGLTPTDIMHIKGDYTKFKAEASFYIASYVAKNVNLDVQEVCTQVYHLVQYRLFSNLVRVLIEQTSSETAKMNVESLRFLLQKQWNDFIRKDNEKDNEKGYFSSEIKSRLDIIGIGGPAEIFVPQVAKLLGRTTIIPEHAKTANALGAALGYIAFEVRVVVECVYEQEKDTYLAVTSRGERKKFLFEQLEESIEYAKNRARTLALEEAKERGILHSPHMQLQQTRKNFPGTEDMLNQVEIVVLVQENLF